MAATEARTYAQAMTELADIRQRLAGVPPPPPEEIETLARRAVSAVAVARAALQRSEDAIEQLGSQVDTPAAPRGGHLA